MNNNKPKNSCSRSNNLFSGTTNAETKIILPSVTSYRTGYSKCHVTTKEKVGSSRKDGTMGQRKKC